MNNISRILGTVVLIVALAMLLKLGYDKFFAIKKVPKGRAEQEIKTQLPESGKENSKEYATLYFLFIKDDGQNVFKQVHRELPADTDKTKFAIEELLKGPDFSENVQKYYTEIPKGTKLLSVTENPDKIIINLNSNFQNGGGADSLYSRVQQLIKTAIANSPNKPIYLYLDGKQADVIGGEGVMIKQPLDEKSL